MLNASEPLNDTCSGPEHTPDLPSCEACRVEWLNSPEGIEERLARRVIFKSNWWQGEQVYFFDCPGAKAIKIGRSDDPAERMRACQTGCPLEIKLLATLPGDHRTETALHAKFEHLRIHGEWFRSEPELVEYIADAAAAHSVVPFSAPARDTLELYEFHFTIEEWCRRTHTRQLAVEARPLEGLPLLDALKHPTAHIPLSRAERERLIEKGIANGVVDPSERPSVGRSA